MRFKIVSVGWQCAQFLDWTLRSVEAQTLDNWDIGIAYDPSTDGGGDLIERWCAVDPTRRICQINTEKKYAIRNQREVLARLAPADDDVLVFLDLDGDQLAHPQVLERLREAYEIGFLVTYGQYRPVPDPGTCALATPYPPGVIANGSYRWYHLNQGITRFNHLRTMAGRIYRAIPDAMFKWESAGSVRAPDGCLFSWQAGDYYEGSVDYVFMLPALELSGGRVKCFDEVLLLYNHANPLADNKTQSPLVTYCLRNFYMRPRLSPINFEIFLPMEGRRDVIVEYARRFGLSTLVESGTNRGDTPWALKDLFKNIYTIELHPGLWAEAARRFIGYPHVQCLHGDSKDVLPQVLARLQEPAVFFLDGHYCGNDTGRGQISTPIREELRALVASGRPHVALVDDARIFEGGSEHHMYDHYADYPSLSWVREFAERSGYRYELRDDIIRLTPKGATP